MVELSQTDILKPCMKLLLPVFKVHLLPEEIFLEAEYGRNLNVGKNKELKCNLQNIYKEETSSNK